MKTLEVTRGAPDEQAPSGADGGQPTPTAQRFPAWAAPMLAGLVLRLLYLVAFPQRAPTSDDAEYWGTALELARGGGYEYLGQPMTERMPGMALLLAPVCLLTGGSLLAARLVMLLLSVVTIPLMQRLGARLMGSERVGFGAAWVVALFPPFWFYSTTILTETVAIALCALGLLCVLQLEERMQWKAAVGLGAVWAGLMYFKPEFSIWGPLLGVGWMLRRLPLRAVATVALVGILAIAPWTARNWVLFHEFIPLKSTGGLLIWWASQDPPVEALGERTPAQVEAERLFIVPNKPGASGRNAGKAGIARIKQQPLRYLRACLFRRLPKLFAGSQTEAASAIAVGQSFGKLWSQRMLGWLSFKVLLALGQVGLSVLGIVGLLLRPQSLVVRMLFFGMVITYAMLLGIPRYSMALMPFLIPNAVAVVLQAQEYLSRKRGNLA